MLVSLIPVETAPSCQTLLGFQLPCSCSTTVQQPATACVQHCCLQLLQLALAAFRKPAVRRKMRFQQQSISGCACRLTISIKKCSQAVLMSWIAGFSCRVCHMNDVLPLPVGHSPKGISSLHVPLAVVLMTILHPHCCVIFTCYTCPYMLTCLAEY